MSKCVHFGYCVDFIILEHNQINRISLCIVLEERSLSVQFTNDPRLMIEHALSVIAENKIKTTKFHPTLYALLNVCVKNKGEKTSFTNIMHTDLYVYLSVFVVVELFKTIIHMLNERPNHLLSGY